MIWRPELYACAYGRSRLIVRASRALERTAFSLADVASRDQRRYAVSSSSAITSRSKISSSYGTGRCSRGSSQSLATLRSHVDAIICSYTSAKWVPRTASTTPCERFRICKLDARTGTRDSLETAKRCLSSENSPPSYELDDQVEFAGLVSDEEVRRAICSADIRLAPDPRNKYTDHSTLVKVAEYMALSRPTVELRPDPVTRHGGGCRSVCKQ